MKIRGNTVGTTTPRPDWEQTDPRKADYIKNKPDIKNGGSRAFQKLIDYTVPEGETLGVGVYSSDVIVLEDIDVSEVVIALEVPKLSAFPANSTGTAASSGLLIKFLDNGVYVDTGCKASMGNREDQVTYGQTEITLLPGAFIFKSASGYSYNGPNIITNAWGASGYRPVTPSGKATGLKLTEGYPNGQILPAGSHIIIYGR